MFTPHAHDVLWFMSGFLALWGVSLIIRGFGHRSRRGTPTCPGCRAAVNVAGLTCPACQFSARSRRDFWPRTPHRPAIAGGAFALLIAAGLYATGIFLARLVGIRSAIGPINTLSAGLVIGVLTIIAWALVGEAPKGRKRCPKCWYEMGPLAASDRFQCPECGHDAGGHNGLLTRRRRTRLAIVMIPLVLLALWVPHIARATQRGPTALIPTTVLIAGMWTLPERFVTGVGATPGGGWAGRWARRDSLADRLATTGEAYTWQVRWASARVRSRLDATTDPQTLRRAMHMALIDDEARSMRATMLRILIQTRDSTDPAITLMRSQVGQRLAFLPISKDDADQVNELLTANIPVFQKRINPADPEAGLWAQLVTLLGPEASPLIPAIASVVEDPSAPRLNRDSAAASLMILTRNCPPARAALFGMLRAGNPTIVDTAMHGGWTMETPEQWAELRRIVDESAGVVLTASMVMYSHQESVREPFIAETIAWASTPGPRRASATAALSQMIAQGTASFDEGFPTLAASVRASDRATKIAIMPTLARLTASNVSSIPAGSTDALDLLRELAGDPDALVAATAKDLIPNLDPPK